MSAVTERVEAAILDHQDDLLELIASGTPPPAILAALTERLETLLPGGRCSILLVAEDGRTLRHGAAPRLPEPYCRAIDGIAISQHTGSCGSAASLGELVVVRDTRTDERWRDFRSLADAYALRACWSSPITAPDGTVLGTFAVYHAEPHEPTSRDVALLARFSGLAAVAIRHAAMLAEVRAAEAARVAAEERSRARGELLSAMSHELRTPMSAIVGYAEMLRTVALPPARREHAVTHLTEAAQHLLGLVEDLLDLARLDAGAVEVNLVRTDARAVLAEAAAVLEPLAAENDIVIRAAPGADAVAVEADPRRLRQALVNLIANAVKFNRAGGSVDLAIQAQRDAVWICVDDTGRGLPAQRDGLFTAFDRLGTDDVPGSGLGLTISKQFVEAMGGRLVLGDRPGGGTSVRVELLRPG